MDQSEYNLPKSRRGKIELLKGILNGERTIEDCRETSYNITLDLTGGDAANNSHLTQDKDTIWITLNL